MASKKTKSKLDDQIDENLKRVYEDALHEAVPEKFLTLIDRLKQADAARKSGGKDPHDT